MDKNVLRVNIYGTEYTIKGNNDANYMKFVADYVDKKMREIDSSLSSRSSLRAAILAALNITDELFQERDRYQELFNSYEERFRQISQQIEEELETENGTDEPPSSLNNYSVDDDLDVKW